MSRQPIEVSAWGWTPETSLVLGIIAIVALVSLEARSPRAQPAHPLVLPTVRLDPNTASFGQLLALPSIGPARARAIIAAREERPFRSLEDLQQRVRGIGPVTSRLVRSHLRFDADDVPLLSAWSDD